jgi:phage shock protein PspC (stress-responsive transcriptional regulator)
MANPTGTETKRFHRYPDEGPLGGVCAGIARYANVDANLVRLGAIVLAVMGPGIPAYVLAWIFLPQADGTVHGDRVVGRTGRWSQVLGVGLIILAVSVLWGDWWWPGRGWVLPFGLLAFGAWLLFKPDEDDEDDVPVSPTTGGATPWLPTAPSATSVAPTSPHPPAGATEAAPPEAPTGAPVDPTAGTDEAVDGADADADTLVAAPPGGGDEPPTDQLPSVGPPPPPAAPRARKRRILGPVVFGALLLWGGIAWLAGVSVEDGLAVGLCILGAGFVAGAFVGGSKVLVLPALLLAAVLVVVAAIDIPLEGGVGERRWEVLRVSDLDDDYELGIGEATLDLGALDLPDGRDAEIEVHLGIGHLEVIVPEGASLDVRAEAGAGEIRVLGHRDEGMGVELDRSFRGDRDGDRFVLDLHVGLGQIEVYEAGRPAFPIDRDLRLD